MELEALEAKVSSVYDTVNRALLWKKCLDHGVDHHLLWLIQQMFDKSTSTVVTPDGQTTEWFVLQTGVQQGATISPWLYSIYINELAKELTHARLGCLS